MAKRGRPPQLDNIIRQIEGHEPEELELTVIDSYDLSIEGQVRIYTDEPERKLRADKFVQMAIELGLHPQVSTPDEERHNRKLANRRVNREQLTWYLLQNPGSTTLEIVAALYIAHKQPVSEYAIRQARTMLSILKGERLIVKRYRISDGNPIYFAVEDKKNLNKADKTSAPSRQEAMKRLLSGM